MKIGQLVIVGTGIRVVGQLTMEAIAWMKNAEKVLFIVSDPLAEEVIRHLNPDGAQSLAAAYAENKPRMQTYVEIIEATLAEVRLGKTVCLAIYGHPGVFVFAAHELIRRARQEGHKARMLPAVSSEDCLIADLGVDPVSGWQSFEATDFLVHTRVIDPFSHVVFWQLGGLGDATFKRFRYDIKGLPQLLGKLYRYYSPYHTVYLYEASIYPAVAPAIRPTPLHLLPYAGITPGSTLYIPPIGAAPVDTVVARELSHA
jgi:hypothetical protein